MPAGSNLDIRTAVICNTPDTEQVDQGVDEEEDGGRDVLDGRGAWNKVLDEDQGQGTGDEDVEPGPGEQWEGVVDGLVLLTLNNYFTWFGSLAQWFWDVGLFGRCLGLAGNDSLACLLRGSIVGRRLGRSTRGGWLLLILLDDVVSRH